MQIIFKLKRKLRKKSNFFAERDRWEMRQCVRLSREIFSQPAFDPYRGPELAPGSDLHSNYVTSYTVTELE